jgi:hypothetical protein
MGYGLGGLEIGALLSEGAKFFLFFAFTFRYFLESIHSRIH